MKQNKTIPISVRRRRVFRSMDALYGYLSGFFQLSGNKTLQDKDVIFQMPDGKRITQWTVTERNGQKVVIVSDGPVRG